MDGARAYRGISASRLSANRVQQAQVPTRGAAQFGLMGAGQALRPGDRHHREMFSEGRLDLAKACFSQVDLRIERPTTPPTIA